MHKTKFGVRPIVNSRNHPTSKICLLLDCIIKPILKTTETYIQDSQNLIQKLNDLNIDEKELHLYSCDFESLYTNIDKNIIH